MEIAFWQYRLMGGELGNEKVICRPSRRVQVYANFGPDRDRQFQYEVRVEQLLVV